MNINVNVVKQEFMDAAAKASQSAMEKYGDFGSCGFAWITIVPKYRGNTKEGKAERKILAELGFEKDWTGRNYMIWNPSKIGAQSVFIREAGSSAGANILRYYGFDAYSNSRLDRAAAGLK